MSKLIAKTLIFLALCMPFTVWGEDWAETPTITEQPSGGTVSLAAQYTLNVSANVADNGTLSYQWYSNTSPSNINGTPIANETSASYTFLARPVGISYYYVEVTNTNNNATNNIVTIASNVATLNVIYAQEPTITTQPTGGTVSIGTYQTLNVSASVTDGGTLGYQWYSNTNYSNAGGTAIEYATNPWYYPNTETLGTFYYYVVVTNTNNNAPNQPATVTSEIVTFNIISTQIITQPTGCNINGGVACPLTVEVTTNDGGTLSYQWYSNVDYSNTSGMAIEGATEASYTPSSATAGTFYYYVVVSNSVSTATLASNVAMLNVNNSTTTTYNLTVNKNPTEGGTVTINAVEQSGSKSYNYGASVTAVAIPQSGYVFNGWSGASTSTNATTTVHISASKTLTANFIVENAATPEITSQPIDNTTLVVEAYNAYLTVSATVNDGGTLSYQWYRNTYANNTGGSVIRGATNSWYYPSTETLGVFYYYVVVTNTNSNTYNKISTARSNVATVAITLKAPANPRDITIVMRSSDNNEWWENTALRISINEVDISPNPSLDITGGIKNFTFTATVGDEIQVYWIGGYTFNTQNAFAIYYTDTPPNQDFNPVSSATNDNDAILVSRQYGNLTQYSDGYFLGNFIVTPSSNTAKHTLNIISTQASGGNVTANGFVISETAIFYEGTQLTLTATPVAGYVFTGWSGSVYSIDNTINLTMNTNHTLTANFIYNPNIEVRHTTNGENNGAIIGVTPAMEYKLKTESEYRPIMGTQITDLAAGTYLVRIAATLTSEAGEPIEVTINASQETPPESNSFTVININMNMNIILNGSESFSIQGMSKPEIVRVFNVKGTILMNRTVIPNENISISHLPKGMYMVNVNGKTFKVVK